MSSDAAAHLDPSRAAHDAVDAVYRAESRRVLATLIRLLGDFDLAEDALHDAFTTALRVWPRDGVPGNPRSWLVSTGRFKAIDRLRRHSKLDDGQVRAAIVEGMNLEPAEGQALGNQMVDGNGLVDDRLRLIFICCHPVLPPDARMALTLREVCGLTTAEIAHAFFLRTPTLAQRIVRAKAKIREASIPYEVPDRRDLPERLGTVLHVIYLMFNEGYLASTGNSLTRRDLTDEAIRLGRLLLELMPEPEVQGLLALMLLHDARRASRTTKEGELVLLENQDRSLWDTALIGEATALVQQALASGRFRGFTLQAAIAALHAEAPSLAKTDWAQIVALYDLLLRVEPRPVIELNRAVAVAMRDGPEAGLETVNGLLEGGELASYSLAHAARADLCRRLGRDTDAAESYRRALDLTMEASQRRFLQARLAEVTRGPEGL